MLEGSLKPMVCTSFPLSICMIAHSNQFSIGTININLHFDFGKGYAPCMHDKLAIKPPYLVAIMIAFSMQSLKEKM